ncbi:MAG: hypothetical protein HYY14_00880 [Candidatus Omnitrophica bacterium]|nr:hypothetical protein [Candidatus Omnitrophota bacterium]
MVWRRVLGFLRILAAGIGRVQGWIIFSILYFVVLLPAVFIQALFRDSLDLRTQGGSLWHTKTDAPDLWKWARAQF